MSLRLALLGPPLIERGGETVAVEEPGAIAVLSHLAVTDRPQRRADLAGLVWPDVGGDHAGAALDRVLVTLRHAAGDIVRDGSRGLALDPGVHVDMGRARALMADIGRHGHGPRAVCQHCAAPLREIAGLHRGAFLEGFAMAGNPVFEHWQDVTADVVRRELAGVLSRLVDVHVLSGDMDDAVPVARRRLSLDPLDEAAHRTLMRLYAWQGRPMAMVRQYRDCVRALQTELGVNPLDETTRLYEDLLAHRDAGPPAPLATAGSAAWEPDVELPAGGLEPAQDMPAVAGPANPPLVAREHELSMLADTIARVHRDGVVIVVEGETGIGRTRLLAELEARTLALGRRVVATACREDAADAAFGAVINLLRSALERPSVRQALLTEVRPDVMREVGRLLPEVVEVAGAPPPPAGPRGAWRLVDAVATALVAAASAPSDEQLPGVIIIDDVQWIDASSLDVVTHLARRLLGGPVCLVLAWRTELVGRGHHLRRLVTDLARRQLVRQLPLNRLDLAAVRTLYAETVGPGPHEVPPADQIMDATEGVPRLVMEYLAALRSNPVTARGSLPASAHDLLLTRLSGIGPRARQVLEAGAVIGGPFDADLLGRIGGRSVEETAAALAQLIAAGLVAHDPDGGTYGLIDDRVRTIAVRRAGPVRRGLLRGRAAVVLERRWRQRRCEPATAGTIAAHYAAAGDRPAAARWYEGAAAHATRLLAIPEAIRYHERALVLGHTRPQDCHEAIGDLRLLAGQEDQALEAFEAAAAMTHDEHIATLEHKIAGVHLCMGRCDLAEQHLSIALTALEANASTDRAGAAALGARILTDQGLIATCRGDNDHAATVAEAALRAAETTDDLYALAHAHNLVGVLSKGDLAVARVHLEHALALARRLRDAEIEIAVADNLAQVHAAGDALDRAVPLAEFALARAHQIGDRHREAALYNLLADLLRAAGRNAEAMAHVKRAVALFAEIGEPDEHTPRVRKLAAW